MVVLSWTATLWLTQGEPKHGNPCGHDSAEEGVDDRVAHYHISADASFFGASTLAA
jgi:hypothetical protein